MSTFIEAHMLNRLRCCFSRFCMPDSGFSGGPCTIGGLGRHSGGLEQVAGLNCVLCCNKCESGVLFIQLVCISMGSAVETVHQGVGSTIGRAT